MRAEPCQRDASCTRNAAPTLSRTERLDPQGPAPSDEAYLLRQSGNGSEIDRGNKNYQR